MLETVNRPRQISTPCTPYVFSLVTTHPSILSIQIIIINFRLGGLSQPSNIVSSLTWSRLLPFFFIFIFFPFRTVLYCCRLRFQVKFRCEDSRTSIISHTRGKYSSWPVLVSPGGLFRFGVLGLERPGDGVIFSFTRWLDPTIEPELRMTGSPLCDRK